MGNYTPKNSYPIVTQLPKLKNTMSEDQIQAKFYQEAYNTIPQVRGLLFSVPNGGTRNVIEAQKLKATGLTPGIPDIICLLNGPIGFEFKTDTGKLSPAQVRIHEIWSRAGIPVHVVRSSDEAMKILKSHIRSTN